MLHVILRCVVSCVLEFAVALESSLLLSSHLVFPSENAMARAMDNGGAPVPEYLRELREDDPTNATVYISLHPDEEPFAVELAQALGENESVDKIYLMLNISTRPLMWGALCRVLAARARNLSVIVVVIDQAADGWPTSVEDRQAVVDASAFFFRAIQQNPRTGRVSLSVPLSGEVLIAFLDGSTNSLVALDLHCFEIGEADVPAVAAAIQRHAALKVVSMHCTETVLQLLRACVKLKTICFDKLLFRVSDRSSDFPLLPQVLETISELKLRRVIFRRVRSRATFLAITHAIPRLRIESLDVMGEGDAAGLGGTAGWDWADAKRLLSAALKKNFCLREVWCDFFQLDDDEEIEFYMNRNARLAEWVENPALVPKHLWPLAVSLAMAAGYDALYRSLRVVVPESNKLRKRKRQHPVYFDPSSNCSVEKKR